MLGRLSRALADFEHPAADRVLAWDLSQVTLLRELDPAPPVLEIIERAERLVLPVLDDLPRQVIHNDFHPGNLLVDPAGPAYISGILDFGDTVRSARVNDLGVALAYLSMGSSPWEAAAPFLDGFESVVPLLDAERALLPHLVAVRLAQRVLLNAMLERDASENSTLGGL
jgi:Ser/Thr protein kinase RdoA (MazF antagonist)